MAGSIYQRRSDGRWCAAFVLPNGQRVVRYARTEREARRLLAELHAAHARGRLTAPTTTTVAEWLQQWQELRAAEWRATTRAAYASRARGLSARLGSIRLDKLTPVAIEQAMGEIARERGSRAAQLAFELLVAALRDARRLGLLGVDVTTDCRRPPHRPRPRRWLTAHELQRLVTSLRHSADPDAPLVLLLVATALRVGELIALRWGDVDLTTGWLYVRRTRLRLNGVWLEQEPKTRAGMRAFPLTALAREALGRLPRGLAPEAFIFDARGPHGGRLLNSDYVERAVRRLCRVADVPPQTPHALRHAAVSAALAHGAPLAEIARVVGHTTPHVTARVYAHALGQPARVAQALNQALEG